MRKKYLKFWQLPKRKQDNAYIRLKNKIIRYKNEYNELFYSDHIIEPERPDIMCNYMDAYFLGSKKPVIWNATIMSINFHAREIIEHESLEEAYNRLTPEERIIERDNMFKFKKIPYKKFYTLEDRTIRYERFNNKSVHELSEEIARDRMLSAEPEVYEEFIVHRNYAYGFGLTMYVDEKRIDVEAVDRSIKRFFEYGEKYWKADKPVPVNHFTLKTMKQILEEEQMPGYLIGNSVRI